MAMRISRTDDSNILEKPKKSLNVKDLFRELVEFQPSVFKAIASMLTGSIASIPQPNKPKLILVPPVYSPPEFLANLKEALDIHFDVELFSPPGFPLGIDPGFNAEYNLALTKRIAEVAKSGPMMVSGWSMGGLHSAMAAVEASKLDGVNPNNIKVATIASPVGADLYKARETMPIAFFVLGGIQDYAAKIRNKLPSRPKVIDTIRDSVAMLMGKPARGPSFLSSFAPNHELLAKAEALQKLAKEGLLPVKVLSIVGNRDGIVVDASLPKDTINSTSVIADGGTHANLGSKEFAEPIATLVEQFFNDLELPKSISSERKAKRRKSRTRAKILRNGSPTSRTLQDRGRSAA
jgi:pimeloyl-ACP methyl ester carboxylesterase